MKARDLVLVVAMCLSIATAIGSGFYMIGGGSASVIAMVIAVIALGFGQVVLFGAQTFQTQLTGDRFKMVETKFNARKEADVESLRRTDFLTSQIAELRNDASRNADLVSTGFSDLKNSYASLAQHLQNQDQHRINQDYEHEFGLTAAINDAPSLQPEPILKVFNPFLANGLQPILPAVPSAPRESNTEVQSPFADELLVSLEPIVDLNSGRTAHYRIHLAMKSKSGEEVSHEALLQQADRMGLRMQLDIFVAREAALLLRRLRQRDPTLIMFMPIGAATLATPEALNQIIADRRSAADIAAGLAFEFPHAVLAGLSDQALEGLASLARQGITLALSNASISGLDLNALATLNVRYVGLDMGALGEQGRPSAEVVGFAQTARATRVHLIVTGVTNPQAIPSLPQVSRLAAGPCFAAPRRVKRELTHEAMQNFNVAA
jgi:EAL domain-containing protein (putative c-di-GMP-specific phosphodiesterase class I)